MDKRYFHNYLNDLKDNNPDAFGLIESVQHNFEENYDAITDNERKSLRATPMQYTVTIPEDDSWTTQLHIWAEQCVPEILDLDPIFLAHKNGYGDSVLMSLISGATGTHTEVVQHKLIAKILNTNMDYEYIDTEDGKDVIMKDNALNVEDANGDSVLDYLMDFAYATGKYKGQMEDELLQRILSHFAGYIDDIQEHEEPEIVAVKEKEESEQPDSQSSDTNSSSTIDSTLD